MAALALPAIIGAEAGTFAFFASAIIGSYIDSQFLLPTLFGNTTEGPKLDDLPVGRWSEGTALPRAFGKATLVPGTSIWQSPLREVKDNASGGGKGGGGGEFLIYKYYADVAIALCAGPVSRVTKIYADGKVLYNVAPDIDISSTQISGAVTNYTPYAGAIVYVLTLTSSGIGSPDLSLIKSGKKVDIDDGTNSGSYSCTSSGTDVTTNTTFCVLKLGGTNGGFSNWSSGAKTVTLYQKLPVLSGEHVASIRFHLGTEDQEPDPLMEAYDGVGEVPAYRGTCYIVLEQLALQDWGNRIPSFTAVIEDDVDRTVPEVIERMLKGGGLTESEYDLSGLLETEFEGMSRNGIGPVQQDLQPIVLAEDIMVQQIDRVLCFKQRTLIEPVVVDINDLGMSDRVEQWSPVLRSDEDPIKLPDEINVQYLDINNEYDTASQRHRRRDPNSREVVTVNLPLAMNTEKARAIATRLFWQAMQAKRCDIVLPPTYLGRVFENSLLVVKVLNQTHKLRVVTIERGANYSLRCECVMEEAITPLSIGEDVLSLASTQQNPRFGAPYVELRIFETRPLRESDVYTPGFYFAACCPDSRYTFTGAVLYESIDNGESWDMVQLIEGAGYIGDVTGYTGTSVSGGGWDLINEITVRMLHGALESRTQLAVLNGANRAMLGDEVIGYADVEYLGDNTYKLSRLIRGLRGSTISNSNDGVSFVQLNQPGIHFHEIASGAIGQPRLYRAVSRGAHIQEATAWSYTPLGLNVMPIPPMLSSVTRDASNNVSAEWLPITRSLGRMFGVNPQHDRVEDYLIEYMDGPTVLRTRTIENARLDAYTSSEQTTDGLTPGDPVTIRVTPYSNFFNYDSNSYSEVTI